MSSSVLTAKKYSKYKSWGEEYPDCVVDLSTLKYDKSWKPLFRKLFAHPKFKKLEEKLSSSITENQDVIIHPAPKLVFNAFHLTPFDNANVVIIGQDPYFDHSIRKSKVVHQAMGLSFSVPIDVDVPSSLANIYRNMLQNGVIDEKPTHGNLQSWATQGCLMLNSSLTVLDGSANKNCHQRDWEWFTNDVIKYISDQRENVIFVLWGKNAFDKMKFIDVDKHDVLASSHPSGLSCNKPMGREPAFAKFNHFGKINELLESRGNSPIDWKCEIDN